MVKWTPENDQLLLLKILETHDLSVDVKRVAEAWPSTDPTAKPTPRAISERLVRIRQIVKSNSTPTTAKDGHFSIGKGKTPTPNKGRKPAPPKTPTSQGKRKRGVKVESEDEYSDDLITPVKYEPEGTPTRNPNNPQAGSTLKLEPEDEALLLGQGTPGKRIRRASTLPPGMVNFLDDELENTEGESEISEYVPEQAKVEEQGESIMDMDLGSA